MVIIGVGDWGNTYIQQNLKLNVIIFAVFRVKLSLFTYHKGEIFTKSLEKSLSRNTLKWPFKACRQWQLFDATWYVDWLFKRLACINKKTMHCSRWVTQHVSFFKCIFFKPVRLNSIFGIFTIFNFFKKFDSPISEARILKNEWRRSSKLEHSLA
jgi:hypothetical protein